MSDIQLQRIRRKLGLEKYPAILGDANGVVEDDPVKRPGMIRVRYATAAGLSLPPIVSIGAYQGSMRPGTSVWVGWQDEQLCLLRPHVAAQVAQGQNPAYNNGADERLKTQNALADIYAFKSHPTSPASASVVVRSLLYLNGTTAVLFDASEDDGSGGLKGKIDLTSSISTAGNHRLICLFLKKSDNTLEVKASTEKSMLDPLGLADLQECLTAASANIKPCWAWKSADAKATFDDSDSWLDLRQIINDSDYASGTYLPLAGGTMAGNIDLGDNALLKALYTDYKSAAAPANPSAGYQRVYLDTADGHLKQRDNLGNVIDLAASGGSYYQTVQDGGSAATQRAALNFIDGIQTSATVADDSGNGRSNVAIDVTLSEIPVTAGEAVSARDNAYLDTSTNKIYKIDTDSAGPLVGAIRGCVVTSAAQDAATTLRVFGRMAGFSSLTAWGRMYASTTAGSYTQTKPDPAAGGSQVAIVDMGYAISTTEIMIAPQPVLYVKRASLANGGTTTITHHVDSAGHTRRVYARIVGNSYGSDITNTSYAICDSAGASYPATQAFDDNAATGWQTNTAAGSNSGTAYIGQDFGNGNDQTVRKFTIKQGGATWAITSVKLQYSDNGSSWSDEGTYALVADDSTQTFLTSNAGAHRYWRLLANSNPSSPWYVMEVEMMLVTSSIESSSVAMADWGSALAAVLSRNDNGSGSNADTNTTFKNNLGATYDLAFFVEIP